MGVIGGVGSAWQRSLDRRHKRRLEILRAKSELKVAQVAARTAPQPIVAQQKASIESQAVRVQRLLDDHDEVTRRWLTYELDVAKLIAFPAMSDGRQPLTAAFLRAKKVADRLRPQSARAKIDPASLTEYGEAVSDYEVAFDIAEKDARRLRDSSFTEVERRRLETAKQLLVVAVDEAATPAERQLAYRRVREELDGLIDLSDEAVEVLEKKVALELTTGPTPAAAASGPSEPQARPVADPVPRPVAQPAPRSGTWPVPSRSQKPPST